MKSGIFAELRAKGISINNKNYIKITAAQEWQMASPTDYYCGNSQITGGDGTAIFDGNLNTAYATLNHNSPDFKNITVEFVKTRVYMYSYSIKTLCGPSREIIVEGSNSGYHWTEIDHMTTPLSQNSIATFTCEKPGSYKFIRFRQIGPIFLNTNNYRLHLNEIEIFGHFVYLCTVYKKRSTIILSSLLSIINFIFSVH